jgi:hypothetical protein
MAVLTRVVEEGVGDKGELAVAMPVAPALVQPDGESDELDCVNLLLACCSMSCFVFIVGLDLLMVTALPTISRTFAAGDLVT